MSRKNSRVRIGCHASGNLAEVEIWARQINRCGGKFYGVTACFHLSCLPPCLFNRSSLQSPAGTQGADAATVTAPDIEATLLTEEQQAQRDTDDLVKALEEAKRKRKDLANKRWDAQVAREKREAEEREADAKVRGRLLANAAVAEVRRRFLRQVEKARMVAERVQVEREAAQSPRKVWMRLGVSISFSSTWLDAEKSAGDRCACERGGGIVETEGVWSHILWGWKRLIAQDRSRTTTQVAHATCASMLALHARGLQANDVRATSARTGTTSAGLTGSQLRSAQRAGPGRRRRRRGLSRNRSSTRRVKTQWRS